MEIVLLPQAQKDRDYWKKSGNKAIMERISALLKDIMEHPYTGIGKPEPLKYDLAGKWSGKDITLLVSFFCSLLNVRTSKL